MSTHNITPLPTIPFHFLTQIRVIFCDIYTHVHGLMLAHLKSEAEVFSWSSKEKNSTDKNAVRCCSTKSFWLPSACIHCYRLRFCVSF